MRSIRILLVAAALVAAGDAHAVRTPARGGAPRIEKRKRSGRDRARRAPLRAPRAPRDARLQATREPAELRALRSRLRRVPYPLRREARDFLRQVERLGLQLSSVHRETIDGTRIVRVSYSGMDAFDRDTGYLYSISLDLGPGPDQAALTIDRDAYFKSLQPRGSGIQVDRRNQSVLRVDGDTVTHRLIQGTRPGRLRSLDVEEFEGRMSLEGDLVERYTLTDRYPD